MRARLSSHYPRTVPSRASLRVGSPSGGFGALALVLALGGCSQKPSDKQGEPRDPITGLTRAEANEVLVTAGDVRITLGEFAGALARMDEYERGRYQTEARQKELLEEMIQSELLAREAKKRGLDRDPDVQLSILEGKRDELLAELRSKLPKPEALPEVDVRAYYDAHKNEFNEPLRHRLQFIVVGTRALGETVAKEAEGASGEQWGELARRYSIERRGLGKDDAPELAGDVGFVSAPGEKRGENLEVPEPVRAAVFQNDAAQKRAVGDVVGPIEFGTRVYVARISGISPARERSLRDADRAIRAELLRQKFLEAERELEAELRKKYPVVIDEARVKARAAELAAGAAVPASPAAPASSAAPAPSLPPPPKPSAP